MIGDHYGPTAWRATVLVRAVDVILGTHRLHLHVHGLDAAQVAAIISRQQEGR